MKKILSVLLLAVSFTVYADQSPPKDINQCAAQIPYGMPVTNKQSTTVICRSAYILEHDNNAKIPKWVSYVLTPAHATGCVPRSNAFASDASLQKGYRSELKDYSKSGYDIGHMANDADMSWNVQVEQESFILSNMSPQLPGFNRGIWKKLEDQTRAWVVERKNPILVYVGPVYSVADKTIGDNNVIVPHAFYKILVDINTREVLVFLFAHESSTQDLSTFITSLAEVQRQTNTVFPMPPKGKALATPWPGASKNVSAAKKSVCGIGN